MRLIRYFIELDLYLLFWGWVVFDGAFSINLSLLVIYFGARVVISFPIYKQLFVIRQAILAICVLTPVLMYVGTSNIPALLGGMS